MEIKKNKPPFSNQEIGTVRIKYLLLCEKDLFTAILLEHFRSFSYWADQQSIGMHDDYHDPAIYNSLAGIAEWFVNAVEPSEMTKAFDFLVSKEYISYRYTDNYTDISRYERVMSVVCDYQKVDSDCSAMSTPQIHIHTRLHREAEARRYEEEHKHYHSVGPKDLKNFSEEDETQEEKRKVKYHNSRAKKANLPATLTIDQWIETLEYFQWKCAYCQKREYTLLEHFIPLGHGKGTTVDNCVPACNRCNNTKQSWNPTATYGPDLEEMKEGFARVQAYLATKVK